MKTANLLFLLFIGFNCFSQTKGFATLELNAFSGLTGKIESIDDTIWVATSKDLIKITPTDTLHYNQYNSGVRPDFINCLTKDSDNKLWIGYFLSSGIPGISSSRVGGYASVKNEVYSDYCESTNGFPSVCINDIEYSSNDSSIYLTFGKYLLRHKLTDNSYDTIVVTPWQTVNHLEINDTNIYITYDNSFHHFNGTIWTTFNTSDGLLSGNIYSMEIDTNGKVLIGTDLGLSVFSNGTFTNYTAFGLPDTFVENITVDPTTNDWYLSIDRYIKKFNGTIWTSLPNLPLTGLPYDSFISDIKFANGKLIALTSSLDENYHEFSGTTWNSTDLDPENNMPSYQENIFIDNDTSIYYLYVNHFYKWELNSGWSYMEKNINPPSTPTYSKIDRSPDGKLWVFDDYALHYYDGQTLQLFSTPIIEPYTFRMFTSDPLNNLWLFGYTPSRKLFKNDGTQWIDVSANIPELNDFNGYDMIADSNYVYLYGRAGSPAYHVKLIIYNKNTNTSILLDSLSMISLGNDAFIEQDSKGNIWIPTGDAIIKVNKSDFSVNKFTATNSGLNGMVPTGKTISIDENNNVWVAGNGLFMYNGFEWKWFNTVNNCMPINSIRDVEFSPSGKIYISTYGKGLLTVDCNFPISRPTDSIYYLCGNTVQIPIYPDGSQAIQTYWSNGETNTYEATYDTIGSGYVIISDSFFCSKKIVFEIISSDSTQGKLNDTLNLCYAPYPLETDGQVNYIWPDTLLTNYTITQSENLVYVRENNCGSFIDTIVISVQDQIILPSSFTPNDDGINDFLDIELPYDYSIENFEIYNSTGLRVFHDQSGNKIWNGKMNNGSTNSTQIFIYRISGKDCHDAEFSFTGKALLIK